MWDQGQGELDTLTLVDQVGETLGAQLTLTESDNAIFYVDLVKGREHVLGRMLFGDGCRCVVSATPMPNILAHELGHCLGLDHVDDPKNLMYFENEWGVALNDRQLSHIEGQIERYENCKF